jgi:hypothetical protein
VVEVTDDTIENRVYPVGTKASTIEVTVKDVP